MLYFLNISILLPSAKLAVVSNIDILKIKLIFQVFLCIGSVFPRVPYSQKTAPAPHEAQLHITVTTIVGIIDNLLSQWWQNFPAEGTIPRTYLLGMVAEVDPVLETILTRFAAQGQRITDDADHDATLDGFTKQHSAYQKE